MDIEAMKRVCEAALELHADLIARAELERDGSRTVNAGRSVWDKFNAAILGLSKDTDNGI